MTNPVLPRESGVYEKVDHSASIERAKKELLDGCPACGVEWKRHYLRGEYKGCAA